MRPVVNGLRQQYGNQLKFADLDFNDNRNQSLKDRFRVVGHPSFVLVDGQGKLVKRWLGIVAASELEKELKQVLNLPS